MEDKGYTRLTLDAKRDINWFTKFLPTFNGTTFFEHIPIEVSMEFDGGWGLMGPTSLCIKYPY